MEDPPDSAFLSPGFTIGGPSALVTHLEKGLDAFELDRRAKELGEGERKLKVEQKLLQEAKDEVEQLYRDLRESTNDQYYRLCEEQKQRLKDVHHEKWARAVATAAWHEPLKSESESHDTTAETTENGGDDVLELEADYGEVEELVSEVKWVMVKGFFKYWVDYE